MCPLTSGDSKDETNPTEPTAAPIPTPFFLNPSASGFEPRVRAGAAKAGREGQLTEQTAAAEKEEDNSGQQGPGSVQQDDDEAAGAAPGSSKKGKRTRLSEGGVPAGSEGKGDEASVGGKKGRKKRRSSGGRQS